MHVIRCMFICVVLHVFIHLVCIAWHTSVVFLLPHVYWFIQLVDVLVQFCLVSYWALYSSCRFNLIVQLSAHYWIHVLFWLLVSAHMSDWVSAWLSRWVGYAVWSRSLLVHCLGGSMVCALMCVFVWSHMHECMCSVGWSVRRPVGWPVGMLAGQPIGRSVGRLAGRFVSS